jgi:hypothetical protein
MKRRLPFYLNARVYSKALEQIDTKYYLLLWVGSEKQLFMVGVDFNYDKRNIGDWKWLELKKK